MRPTTPPQPVTLRPARPQIRKIFFAEIVDCLISSVSRPMRGPCFVITSPSGTQVSQATLCENCKRDGLSSAGFSLRGLIVRHVLQPNPTGLKPAPLN